MCHSLGLKRVLSPLSNDFDINACCFLSMIQSKLQRESLDLYYLMIGLTYSMINICILRMLLILHKLFTFNNEVMTTTCGLYLKIGILFNKFYF